LKTGKMAALEFIFTGRFALQNVLTVTSIAM